MEEDDEVNTERQTAELKVSDLEEELAAAARLQKEVGRLERANDELKEFAESLAADAELEILREQE